LPQLIYIHVFLKTLTEKYLLANNPHYEHGGCFLGTSFELMIPRFIPNVSPNPTREYQMASHYQRYLDIDKKMFRFDFEVHFHTHPNHSIVSEADLKSAISRSSTLYNILLSFDKQKESFTWRCYDRNGEEHYIEFIDKQFEKFKQFFAKTYNILYLGESFLTESGELVTNNPFSKCFIQIDEDALRVFRYITKKQRHSYRTLTKALLQKELSLSSVRIDRALKKLITNQLIKW